jgi:hypothetical protein
MNNGYLPYWINYGSSGSYAYTSYDHGATPMYNQVYGYNALKVKFVHPATLCLRSSVLLPTLQFSTGYSGNMYIPGKFSP